MKSLFSASERTKNFRLFFVLSEAEIFPYGRRIGLFFSSFHEKIFLFLLKGRKKGGNFSSFQHANLILR